jgi:hypothetical protein
MTEARLKILNHLGTTKRATIYHLTNKRGMGLNTKASNSARGMAFRIAYLEKNGFIKKTDQGIVREGVYRTQYYELTKKGASRIGRNHSVDFPIHYPSIEHQYGLNTIVSSIYLNQDEPVVAEYPADKKKYGYRPDCVMHFLDKSYIVEFERSKGMDELVKHVRQRDKILDTKSLPKDHKFIYVLNITKSKNKNNLISMAVDPVYIYDEYNQNEKREEEFMLEFMDKIKDLPSWRYRVQILPNFEKFGEAIWYAPGKKEKFKLH